MATMKIPTTFVEKAKFVRVIFTDVQREYDALLHLMTLSFDWVWRRRMLSKLDFSQRVRVLDLACGTGLVTFELSHRAGPNGLVVGLDLSPAMLVIAHRKKHLVQSRCLIEFVRGAGEYLPFREGAFRYVTVGLALRNFANRLGVFRETLRVLLRSGWFLSVDFVRPRSSVVWRFYKFHIFYVLPAIGRIVSGYWDRTLTYLANSIMLSSAPDEICRALLEVGFRHTSIERMTLGMVALVGGRK